MEYYVILSPSRLWIAVMERVQLKNIEINGISITRLHVFLDDDGEVLCLPLLWAAHLAITGNIYRWSEQGEFRAKGTYSRRFPISINRIFLESEVSENTIQNYIGHLFHFLTHVNEVSKGTPCSIQQVELIKYEFVNDYLNNVLPSRVTSVSALYSHQAAISAFFSFLFHLDLRPYTPFTILRKTKQLIAETDDRHKKISYVTRHQRSVLSTACNTLRDRLILRMGYEVGLRTSENRGLVLNDFKAKNKSNKGLAFLFEELSRNPTQDRFQYLLNGKFTKGGRSRYIFFTRELLEELKHYHDTERLSIVQDSGRKSDHLFLKNDYESAGLPIAASHGTKLFNNLKNKCPTISSLSYHDLRHTFATELYHEELIDSDNRETRSESAALIVVAERLGHKNVESTKIYIRLRQQMLMLEKAQYG